MTEKEKCTDEALKNCIQEAYGLSDEQLLAELEELEASLSDDEFVGAEDRIYNKIKERENERSSEPSEMVVPSEAPASSPISIRKISKKKKLLVVGIAAVLAVGAGVNAIGGNNYFLREREKEQGIVLNSGQNIIIKGNLEEAYTTIQRELGISVLKMNYMPKELIFQEMVLYDDKAILVFQYEDEKIYFMQSNKELETSIGVNSDRSKVLTRIANPWISQEILIESNLLEGGKCEYSAMISISDANYRLVGILPEEEFVEIINKISY